MKKTYSKPLIAIESFALSTNMAGDCEKPFNLQAQFICGIPDDTGRNRILFTMGIGGECNTPGDGNSVIFDGFCYHVPTENNELFNS